MAQPLTPTEPRTGQSDLAERVQEHLTKDRNQTTLMLASQLEVPEVEVIRLLPNGASVELDITRWEELIRSFESLGKVHVVVSSGAVTIEAFGQFGGFSKAQGFFNVQSKSLDMHLRSQRLAAAFAVRKPSHVDGHETISFQFYDQRGAAAFKVFLTFGGHAPSAELAAQFDRLVEQFRVPRDSAVNYVA